MNSSADNPKPLISLYNLRAGPPLHQNQPQSSILVPRTSLTLSTITEAFTPIKDLSELGGKKTGQEDRYLQATSYGDKNKKNSPPDTQSEGSIVRSIDMTIVNEYGTAGQSYGNLGNLENDDSSTRETVAQMFVSSSKLDCCRLFDFVTSTYFDSTYTSRKNKGYIDLYNAFAS
ncbi:hypothetical protein K435DRAFT_809865 [Dendrothele bispora CBS 962.96]|uniref:Uncharacterized protein n=1 Tax=Dendrothele bispora (strain CBS 962.96) TaxID=1314807 RepID=A0A4S8KX91_DENBC|nr:hypothetical protein K435DRAFT_809865 [Dendrothele bispora CBS 962.96]